MSEKPILFSGSMVRAILAGTKTQTRRTVKHRPFFGVPNWDKAFRDGQRGVHEYLHVPQDGGEYGDETIQRIHSPYSDQAGDRLWVRETFKLRTDGSADAWYRADGHIDIDGWPWKPSIFMPRSLSRITLEITSVRVERLNEISEEDARAEGIDMPDGIAEPPEWWSYSKEFQFLWDSINGKKCPWASNPWVWAISFRTLPAAAGGA